MSFEQLRVIQNSRWTRGHGRAVLEGAELGQGSVEVVQIVVEVEHWISAGTKTNFRRYTHNSQQPTHSHRRI